MIRVPETSVVVGCGGGGGRGGGGAPTSPTMGFPPGILALNYACTLCILCICTVGPSEAACDGGVPQARHHGKTHQTAIKAGAPRYLRSTYNMYVQHDTVDINECIVEPKTGENASCQAGGNISEIFSWQIFVLNNN